MKKRNNSILDVQKSSEILKKLIKCSILLGFFLNQVETFSQTNKLHPIEISTKNCINNDGTTLGMITCLETAIKEWDIELNKNYKKLISLLGETDKNNLQESQREWIIFRDKEYIFNGSLYSKKEGTMWPLLIIENKNNLVKARAIELKEYYDLLILSSE